MRLREKYPTAHSISYILLEPYHKPSNDRISISAVVLEESARI
ncbi:MULTISPECIES: hypothetical protein [unclassified Microcoleus]